MSRTSNVRSGDPMYNWNNPQDVDLINNATAPTEATFDVTGESALQVEIYGTASAATVEFYTIGRSGEERPIMGYKQMDASTTATGGMDDVISFEVTFADKFVARLTSVTEGAVSVNGRAV